MAKNYCHFVGRAVKDAELKVTGNNMSVCNFRIAINENFKDSEGAWKPFVEYANCIIWGKYSEVMAPKITKGVMCAVDARLHTRSWDDKQSGEKRYAVEFTVKDLVVGGAVEAQEDTEDGDAVPF